MSTFAHLPAGNSNGDPKLRLAISTGRSRLILVIGGTATVAAVVMGMIELAQREPAEVLRLLTSWGPWFLVAIIAIWGLHSLLLRAVEYVGQLALNVGNLAGAVQQIAAKDDRNADRLITLVTHAARKSEETYDIVSKLHRLHTQEIEKQRGT